MSIQRATEILTTEGYQVNDSLGRRVFWTCPAGHQKWQDVYDAIKGRRCAKCRRASRTPPRKPILIEVGATVGDLLCVQYLGVVDGHSRVVARNVINGREAVMTTNQFLKKKWKLHTLDERREISRAANILRAGQRNVKNSKYNFGDLRKRCLELGFSFEHDISDNTPLYDTRRGGAWTFKCHCGAAFSPQINNILGSGVRSCGCTKSHIQAELLRFVQQFCPDAVPNDRTKIKPFELDIWIPSKSLGIEYTGLYWHGEELNGPSARVDHANKLKMCEAAGIRLITMFEDEWLLKRTATESYLKAILGAKRTVVGGRETGVVLNSSGDLIRKTHLQGPGRGFCIGLEFDGAVVAEAKFSAPDASRGRKREMGVWELNRFCVADDVSVPGALSKIIKAFWSTKPEATSLYSFSDRRWSQGGVYRAVGFKYVKETPPCFWWFKKNTYQRFHRFTYRASRVRQMFPNDVGTAWEIMNKNGWDRIWDCGTVKWELHRP